MRRNWLLDFILFFIVFYLKNENYLEASHFRGGSLTAYASSYTVTSVTMTITANWAYSTAFIL